MESNTKDNLNIKKTLEKKNLGKELCISSEWCKGCGICVEFCPKGVLQMSESVVIAYPNKCIKCGICEKLCPDYAIYIENDELVG